MGAYVTPAKMNLGVLKMLLAESFSAEKSLKFKVFHGVNG